jgi:uncharacterized membrane protein YdbT with pleckstrin-like domain
VSYVNSVLQPGETVKVIGRLHWIIFLRALVLLVIGLVIMIYSQSLPQQTGQLVTLVGWAVLLVSALAFLHAWFIRWITELSVTNRRVIYKRGFLRRHTVEMNMDKIETVKIEQSILGRLLGYGTIRLLGTGQGIEGLDRLGSPMVLRNAITAR